MASDTPTRTTVSDLTDLLAEPGNGVHWSLEPPSDLNVNLVRLEPGHEIGEHVNQSADVAIVVIAGSGQLVCGREEHLLVPNTVANVPRGTSRRIVAGENGLGYLTVHGRRSLTIGTAARDDPAGS
ncbi:MAG: hypothetical protein U5K30_13770 [Acidimicrobiales bacterium]|nr:hypothetical protein [Acidimicrobiales bacterium]